MTHASQTSPNGRATRDAITLAATRAFAARGYRGASIDSIATEVGVSRQGVLHHFPSKVKLLIAVLAQRAKDDTARATQLFEQHDGSLLRTFQALSRPSAEQRGIARLYSILSAESVDPEHPAHDYFVARYQRSRAVIAEWIANEQAHRRITDAIEAERLASVVLALMDGLQLQAQLEEDAVDIEQIAEELFKLFTLPARR